MSNGVPGQTGTDVLPRRSRSRQCVVRHPHHTVAGAGINGVGIRRRHGDGAGLQVTGSYVWRDAAPKAAAIGALIDVLVSSDVKILRMSRVDGDVWQERDTFCPTKAVVGWAERARRSAVQRLLDYAKHRSGSGARTGDIYISWIEGIDCRGRAIAATDPLPLHQARVG